MNGLEKGLHKYFQNMTFESLDIPLIIWTTCVQTGLSETFQKGDIIKPIIASSSIPGLFEPMVLNGKQYIDVCDDIALSSIARSKAHRELAVKCGGAAVISTGIWPGGSSLFAQKIIDSVGGKENVEKVKFTFFTAGTGNAGPTLLAATFLILGEDVLTYVNGQKVYKKSATDLETVDFGKDIGMREVVRLNLIECESCHSSGE